MNDIKHRGVLSEKDFINIAIERYLASDFTIPYTYILMARYSSKIFKEIIYSLHKCFINNSTTSDIKTKYIINNLFEFLIVATIGTKYSNNSIESKEYLVLRDMFNSTLTKIVDSTTSNILNYYEDNKVGVSPGTVLEKSKVTKYKMVLTFSQLIKILNSYINTINLKYFGITKDILLNSQIPFNKKFFNTLKYKIEREVSVIETALSGYKKSIVHLLDTILGNIDIYTKNIIPFMNILHKNITLPVINNLYLLVEDSYSHEFNVSDRLIDLYHKILSKYRLPENIYVLYSKDYYILLIKKVLYEYNTDRKIFEDISVCPICEKEYPIHYSEMYKYNLKSLESYYYTLLENNKYVSKYLACCNCFNYFIKKFIE